MDNVRDIQASRRPLGVSGLEFMRVGAGDL